MLSNLSSYQISDFIPYSLEAYKIMLQEYNQSIFPLQFLFVIFSMLVIKTLIKSDTKNLRPIFGTMGLLWFFLAKQYFNNHYMQLNWFAYSFAFIFYLQAMLMILTAFSPFKLHVSNNKKLRWVGISTFILSSIFPTSMLFGFQWSQLTLFGWGPTFTAMGTIAFSLTIRPLYLSALINIIPLLFFVYSILVGWERLI